MSDHGLTYTFEGDTVYAIHEGRVVASGDDMPAVESDAIKYLESLTSQRDKKAADDKRKKATHIMTPNGLKGEILGRTPTIWGNEITVRFENGTISKFAAHSEAEMPVEWTSEEKVATNPVDRLSAVLDEDYSHDRSGLTARTEQLGALAREAQEFIVNGAPSAYEIRLDQIVSAANYERGQIKEAIDHLDAADAEIIGPPTHDYQVAEQESMGRSNDWLDVVAQEMIDESEGQDYDKLLSEGPSLFVTDLDTGALADSGTTREMAIAHVVSKTAGYAGTEVEEYREKFVAHVEVARQDELASRKDTTHKEAAAEKEANDNAPDESLFM